MLAYIENYWDPVAGESCSIHSVSRYHWLMLLKSWKINILGRYTMARIALCRIVLRRCGLKSISMDTGKYSPKCFLFIFIVFRSNINLHGTHEFVLTDYCWILFGSVNLKQNHERKPQVCSFSIKVCMCVRMYHEYAGAHGCTYGYRDKRLVLMSSLIILLLFEWWPNRFI